MNGGLFSALVGHKWMRTLWQYSSGFHLHAFICVCIRLLGETEVSGLGW